MTLKLDENQQKAVEHFQGPALVVAGPGSGKTTVIKERILHLIQKHDVDPEHILAIAFTNAAAGEMENRLSNEPALKDSKPKICTLHVFGKDIITEYHELAGFSEEPNTWDADDIEQTVNKVKTRLNIENKERFVYIYKFEGNKTGRCYIGQTIDMDRREREHRTFSSNRGLREALKEGDEHFNCKKIKRVKGLNADREEEQQINFYKNCSVVNLALGIEHIKRECPETFVTIYKIKLPTMVTCWIGISTDTDPEGIKNEAFRRAMEDESIKAHPEHIKEVLSKAIENEDIKSAAFEIVATVSGANAAHRVRQEIEKHKKWAVFNRDAPLQASESNKRRIEIFCQHFNVSYDEVLKHTPKFSDLMKKFDSLKDDIENAKRQVTTGVFDPDKITDFIFRAFARRYESAKQEANAIDFLDMLIHSANLLEDENNKDILQDYREKYPYVHVDEFQDISPVDFRLIDLFSENLFAVGDDDQAIYGFRGGDSQIMQETFGKRENVTHYEITRNYRSTSTIVRHAKALIEHNPERIPKNLRAKNSDQNQVEIFETPQKTVKPKEVLLRELSNLLTTDLKKVGILARNWKGEINEIQKILDFSELQTQGFEIGWEELGDPGEKNRRKIILRRGTKEIEILNIYTAKGREWEKVIFLVNTIYDSLPDDRNDLTEERRLFYVAITRAKQELVILDGGNCRFISEFQNVPPTKEDMEKAFREELAVREPKFKVELEEASKAASITLESKLKKELEKATKIVREQYEFEINRLCRVIREAQNETKKTKLIFPQQLKSINDAFLEGLIPVLGEFESQIKSLPVTIESNNGSNDSAAFTESVQLAHKQLLDSLKNHGLKPIEACGKIFNSTYHEKVSPDIYSGEVQAGKIANEEQRGYLLHNRVVRKAQVVISKRKQRADVFLSQDFAQPVRFVTYAGMHDLRNIKTFADQIKGIDLQSSEVQLRNLDILFAFPKEDMESLKSHIQKRLPLARRKLKPIQAISERFHVADDILKSLLFKQDAMEFNNQDSTVQFITRSGYVLNGHLWDFDEDFLYMHINKKFVIIYRPGIKEFKNLIWNKITKAYRNGTPINGHVAGQIKGGLRVKFQSLTGFLPTSEVELHTVQQLDSYIGKTYEMMVIEINRTNNHFVLSRRTWLKEQKAKFLNSLSEISDEPPKLRVIRSMNKTVAAMPMIKKFSLALEVQRVPLYGQINLIVSKPVKEVIDTPTPMSKDFSEILDTCVQELKPETLETLKTKRVPLDEPIDLIVPEPTKEVVDSRLPMPKDFSEIPNSQIQNLILETLEIEIVSKHREAVNNNSQLTPQEREDILNTHIKNLKPETLKTEIASEPLETVNNNVQTLQEYENILNTHIKNLKPETSETKNPNSVTQESTLETEADSDTRPIKGQDSSEDKSEHVKKNLGYYLRQSGRFAVEKIKGTIFRKPTS